MPEYTYKDVIIDPTLEEAKNCIGKEVYFGYTPSLCRYHANNNSDIFCGILQGIEEDASFPFLIRGDRIKRCSSIIPCKEEPKPEYVPFESADEFIEAYDSTNYAVRCGTMQNRLLNYGGIWLINTVSFDSYMMVTEVWNDGLTLGTDPEVVTWEELLRDYTLLDGTPCGKLKEKKDE